MALPILSLIAGDARDANYNQSLGKWRERRIDNSHPIEEGKARKCSMVFSSKDNNVLAICTREIHCTPISYSSFSSLQFPSFIRYLH